MTRLTRRIERMIVCPTWADRTAWAIVLMGAACAIYLTVTLPAIGA